MTPRARRDGLLYERVGDEVILYDSHANRAHRLNRTAAMVWQNADGTRTIADHAAMLRRDLDPLANEELVAMAIEQLRNEHLLDEQPGGDAAVSSRRQFARRAAVGAVAALVPMVTSIAAPAPTIIGSHQVL